MLKQEAHLNTLFAHLLSFIRTFNLVDKKEMQPLDDLIRILSPVL